MRINRKEIVEKFAGRAGISQEIARQIVDIFFEEIAAALERGERVEFRGFGSFTPKRYEACMKRNPAKNEPVWVPAKVRPLFRLSEMMSKALNNGRPKKSEKEAHPASEKLPRITEPPRQQERKTPYPLFHAEEYARTVEAVAKTKKTGPSPSETTWRT